MYVPTYTYRTAQSRVRLKADAKALDASATALQRAKILERKIGLQRKIQAWTDLQRLYMPEVTVTRAQERRAAADTDHEIPSYDISLHLPSSLTQRMRTHQKLFEYEFRLRTAQAYEGLEEVRRHLRLRTHMYKYKDKHLVGQRANTRSRNLLTRVQTKVDASAAKYTRARHALGTLAERTGAVGWDTQLQPLNDEDIRAFADESEKDKLVQSSQRKKKGVSEAHKKALGEGYKKLSWIWMVVGVRVDGDDKAVQEGEYSML